MQRKLLTQKMIIDADEAAMDGILKEAKKIVKKIEAGCYIYCKVNDNGEAEAVSDMQRICKYVW